MFKKPAHGILNETTSRIKRQFLLLRLKKTVECYGEDFLDGGLRLEAEATKSQQNGDCVYSCCDYNLIFILKGNCNVMPFTMNKFDDVIYLIFIFSRNYKAKKWMVFSLSCYVFKVILF